MRERAEEQGWRVGTEWRWTCALVAFYCRVLLLLPFDCTFVVAALRCCCCLYIVRMLPCTGPFAIYIKRAAAQHQAHRPRETACHASDCPVAHSPRSSQSQHTTTPHYRRPGTPRKRRTRRRRPPRTHIQPTRRRPLAAALPAKLAPCTPAHRPTLKPQKKHIISLHPSSSFSINTQHCGHALQLSSLNSASLSASGA